MPDDQDLYIDTQIEEQSEIADHIFGMVAKRNGEPRDDTRGKAWLRGWDEESAKNKTGR